MQPAIVEQGAHVVVFRQDRVDRRAWRLYAHGQPERVVKEVLAGVDRLPRQAPAQQAAVALNDAKPTRDIMKKLVPPTEEGRRHHRAIILQANPACHDHRRGQDQLKNAEPFVPSQS